MCTKDEKMRNVDDQPRHHAADTAVEMAPSGATDRARHATVLRSIGLSPEKRRVRVLFVRHAMSCTNMLHNCCTSLPARRIIPLLYRDPLLTDVGVQQARDQGDRLRTALQSSPMTRTTTTTTAPADGVDLVASSTLLRAMETAHFMFPDRRVVTLPYVSERHNVHENVALSPKEQQAVLREANPSAFKRLDWRFANDRGRNVSKCNAFVPWLGSHLYDLLPTEQGFRRPLTIVVVTHSTYMRHCVDELAGAHPLNTQVVCAAFDRDEASGAMERLSSTTDDRLCSVLAQCESELRGYEPPNDVNVGDVSRCRRQDLMRRHLPL